MHGRRAFAAMTVIARGAKRATRIVRMCRLSSSITRAKANINISIKKYLISTAVILSDDVAMLGYSSTQEYRYATRIDFDRNEYRTVSYFIVNKIL